jgi:hypothetical protein
MKRCFRGAAFVALLWAITPAPARAADAPVKNDELIAALIEALGDPNGEVRLNVATALANLGDAAVPSLIESLGSASPLRRAGAATSLSRVYPPAQAAVPALLKAMKDKDDLVRREVSYALSRIVGFGPGSPPPPPARRLPPLDPPPGPNVGGL